MKKIFSLLTCGLLVLSLGGCSITKDKKALKQAMENEIENYDEVGIPKDEYKIYIQGKTLIIEQHESAENFYGWKIYGLNVNDLADITSQHSGVIKECIRMYGGSEKCHVKIIYKDFNTNEEFIVVQDGEIIYSYLD